MFVYKVTAASSAVHGGDRCWHFVSVRGLTSFAMGSRVNLPVNISFRTSLRLGKPGLTPASRSRSLIAWLCRLTA